VRRMSRRKTSVCLCIGSEIRLQDGPGVLLATDAKAMAISPLSSRSPAQDEERRYSLGWSDLDSGLPGCLRC